MSKSNSPLTILADAGSHRPVASIGAAPVRLMLAALLLGASLAVGCSKSANPSGDPSGKKTETTSYDAIKCNENKDCASGKYCYNQTICLTETEICSRLDCDNHPGVCDADAGRCVAAADGNCLTHGDCNDGDYCDDFTFSCKVNTCEVAANGKRCPGGGECVRGNCQNKDVCEQASDCLPTSTCVKQNATDLSGTCVDRGKECSCSGNQECRYNPISLVSKCAQNSAGCGTSTDCKGLADDGGDLTCFKTRCVDPATITERCQNDIHETDDEANPTDLQTTSDVDQMTLCNGDNDWFTFDPSANAKSGELVVIVTVKPEDAGRKGVKVTVIDTNNEAHSAEADDHGVARVQMTYDPATMPAGNFKIHVEGLNEDSVKDLPFTYGIVADVVTQGAIDVCGAAKELENLVPVTGSFKMTSQSDMEHSCAPSSVSLLTEVYRLNIKTRSSVTLIAEPSMKESDITLALRSACESGNTTTSELFCVNNRYEGGRETINTILEPGQYFVMVTPGTNRDDFVGDFTVTAKVDPTRCTPAADVCDPIDTDYLWVCNAEQTQRDRVFCALGCDAALNSCRGEVGDTCKYAIEIDSSLYNDYADPKKHFKKTFQLSNLNNTYSTSCSGRLDSDNTAGKDIVFRTTIPAGHALIGEIVGGGVTSAYIVEDCTASSVAQCLASWSNDRPTISPVELSYKNEGSEPKEVYIVVDYRDFFPIPSSIEVDFTVAAPKCVPGEAVCADNGQLLLSCNQLGMAFDGPSTNCECTAGTGTTCKTNKNDNCSTAETLDFGRTLFNQNTKVNHNSFNTPKGCGAIPRYFGGGGKDAIYKFSTKKNHNYRITVTPEDPDKIVPMFWIAPASACVGDQMPTSACLTGLTNNKETPLTGEFFSDHPQDLLLIIEKGDRFSPEEGDFSVHIDEIAPDGIPFTHGVCDATGTHIPRYNTKGKAVPYACSCTPGASMCNSGDLNANACVSAPTLYDGTPAAAQSGRVENIVLKDNINIKYMPPLQVSRYTIDECYINSSYRPKDLDKFYRFVLNAGDTLDIQYNDDTWQAFAFFQKGDDCGHPQKCVGSKYGRGSAPLNYVATEDNEEVYLVIKAVKDQLPQEVSFKWDVIPADPDVCPHDSTICKGNKVWTCDSNGKKLKEYDCGAKGCNHGACVTDPVRQEGRGDNCGDTAIDVGQGGVFVVNNTSLSNKENPGCVDEKSIGNDIFFKVNVTSANSVISVKAQSLNEANTNVYILKDCSRRFDSCIAGSRDVPTANYRDKRDALAATRRIVERPGTYYVVVDTESSGLMGNFHVEIGVEEEADVCKTGQTCDASGSGVTYCEEGTAKTLACSACETDNVHCQTRQGDVCADAIRLNTTYLATGYHELKDQSITSTESHDFLSIVGKTNGKCAFGGPLLGSEKYYSVDLNEGDVLDVRLNAHKNLIGYLMEGCNGTRTCVQAMPEWTVGSAQREMQFKAPKTATYYFVVDRTAMNKAEGERFSISYNVTPKDTFGYSCIPFSSICDGNTLKSCNSKGQPVDYECKHGCEHGLCKVVDLDIDSCASAPVVSNGFAGMFILGNLNNNSSMELEPKCTVDNSGSTYSTYGREGFVRVDLPGGAVLRAYVESFGHGEYAAVYISSECGDSTTIGATCVKGYTERFVGQIGPVTYRNTTAATKTLYVAFDERSASTFVRKDNPSVIARIEVDKPDCTPKTDPLTCDNSTGMIKYCDPASEIFTYYACSSQACGTDGCGTPNGEVCEEAIPLTVATDGTETVVIDTPATTKSDYSLKTGNSFTNSKPTPGTDKVYAVDVPAGKTLTAKLASTVAPTKEDLALYVANNCSSEDFIQYVVAGSDNPGEDAEMVTVANTTADTVRYYIVIDTAVNVRDYSFELKVSIQ